MKPDDDIIGDVVDPTNLAPEPPEPVVHEPPVESPRWNEIYGKMKDFERQLDEKDQTLKAVVDHNKSLQDSMDGLYDKVSVTERPDQIIDPDGYDKWILDQAVRKIKKEQPAPAVETKAKTNPMMEQVKLLQGMHKDFNQVAAFANEIVEKDPLKKNEIRFSDNPPRALYEYGLKLKSDLEAKRKKNISQAGVEGGSLPPSDPGTTTLTAAQERARIGLGVSKENYIKQLNFINKSRG